MVQRVGEGPTLRDRLTAITPFHPRRGEMAKLVARHDARTQFSKARGYIGGEEDIYERKMMAMTATAYVLPAAAVLGGIIYYFTSCVS